MIKGQPKKFNPNRKPIVPVPMPVVPYVGPTPKISLSIIVKNEAKVIERMLNTVWPILDYYVVVDTGSTDGTQDIVRRFFEAKNIPGEVVDHEWVSFEDARNTALNLVKGKADFGFWIDADETFEMQQGTNIELLKRRMGNFDGANVEVHYGGQKYFRMQFFSTKKPWRWYGPIHEVLVCDEPSNVAVVEGVNVRVNPDGNSWTSQSAQQKYEDHAKVLLKYVENDPKKDPRWLFYLAQSYRDAGTPENAEKSIHWYRERIKAGNGFWEEIYYSQLMVAAGYARTGKPVNEILEEYLKCGKYNRLRIEHLMPLVQHYHDAGEFDTSYIYSSHAMKIAGNGRTPFPQVSLFVDNASYEWRILQLHMLNCWMIGRKDESKETYKKLVKARDEGKVPPEISANIDSNAQFFK